MTLRLLLLLGVILPLPLFAEAHFGSADYRLNRALMGCQEENIAAALQDGADPNAILPTGETGMIHCLSNRAILQLLLRAGADVNAKDRKMAEPVLFRLAAQPRLMHHDGYQTALLLLEHNADIRMSNEQGKTVLHKFARNPHGASMIERLIARRADVNARDGIQRTPLHDACEQGLSANVQMLLTAGADIEASDAAGSTPLTVAISRHHVHVIQVLLEAGADPDREYKQGLNALHLAIFNRRPFMVEALLEGGANPNYQPQVIPGRRGMVKTPLQYALDLGDQAIFDILLGYQNGRTRR